MKKVKCFICGKLFSKGKLVRVRYSSKLERTVLVCPTHPGVDEACVKYLESKCEAASEESTEN